MPRRGLAQIQAIHSIADQLALLTHFNTDECKNLLMIYEKINKQGKIDRLKFREILHTIFDITDDVMLDLTFRSFDRDFDGVIDESEWVKGLSVMLRGELDELIEFVYFVYDMNGDRSLAREELFHCLRGCIHPGYGVDSDEIEEVEKEIVEIAMKKLDVDRDGQITYEDFVAACHIDPLLLQAVGPCLPTAKASAAFLAVVTEDYRAYTGCWGHSWLRGKTKKSTNRTNYLPNGRSSMSTSKHNSSKINNVFGPVFTPSNTKKLTTAK